LTTKQTSLTYTQKGTNMLLEDSDKGEPMKIPQHTKSHVRYNKYLTLIY